MLDVLVAGAGPAGAVAAIVLARAGARVVMIDRAAFPRDKLCGDTLNPGAIALLAGLGLTGGPLDTARPLYGMRLTGPRAAVVVRYGSGVSGLAVRRVDLDAWLVREAVRSGARFESGVTARGVLVEDHDGVPTVRGLLLARRGGTGALRLPAVLTIGADGRRSAVGQSAGLMKPSGRRRRWAYGAYVSGVAGMTDVGEMHVHGGWYVGLAPVADGLVNVCLVRRPGPDHGTPREILRRAIAADAELSDRLAGMTFESDIRVLGPLATRVRAVGDHGVLLAGDASGFVDPMTGDGLHLAMQSAVLAAQEALRTLESGDLAGAPARLRAARQAAFGRKLRFNRAVKRLVDSPAAVHLADMGARVAPALLERAVRYAGDVP
ncbi:MAG: NAD(P)/FAD-dependent oxidoreductase [Acidobacteria bacterium]|nr:NAD(P)/FAD-dependent oxidoreductase [Acidobacteriota bacterium]